MMISDLNVANVTPATGGGGHRDYIESYHPRPRGEWHVLCPVPAWFDLEGLCSVNERRRPGRGGESVVREPKCGPKGDGAR